MHKQSAYTVPVLYVKGQGEQTTKLELKLTTARRSFLVRLTGGCGLMSADDADGLYELFVEAFEGFEGAMLFGGSRSLRRDDPNIVVPGITEIPPLIRENCTGTVILGVVPKTDSLYLSEHGLVISDDKESEYVTIVHPCQDICLVIQHSADDNVKWESEYEECLRITEELRSFAGFRSLMISYNGGTMTEREILLTARRGWPVLLIKDSGRKTDEYAQNQKFLDEHPNVRVAERDSTSIRENLIAVGAIEHDSDLIDVDFEKRIAVHN